MPTRGNRSKQNSKGRGRSATGSAVHATRPGLRRRVTKLLTGRALGALVAQVWQAVGSFGLQLFAAWLLGASGLGLLSLCLSIIVLTTAVASGMIGDSLVILDRHDRRIRGGLQAWTLILVGLSFAATTVAMTASGLLTLGQALLMSCALVAFQLEELVRRVFMATMRFWRLVVIDSAAVLSALAIVGIWASIESVPITAFFIALLTGQLIGIVVGIVMLPPAERALVSMRQASIRSVAAFGAWRGAQVSVPPLVLTTMRVIVTGMVGAAALGELELARIYVAPALLSVQGLASYLLSTYVRDKDLGVRVLARRARRWSLAMIGAALLAGAALTFVAPMVAHRISGPQVDVDRVVLAGWVLYVAASASCQPFASLAAARGRPALVLSCGIVDAAAVIIALPLLLWSGVSASWTPYVLAGGLFLGGVLVRQFALKPLFQIPLGPTVEHAQSRTIYASR